MGGGGRGRDGFVLLALPTFLPSVISSFFTKNKGGPGPPTPSLDSQLLRDGEEIRDILKEFL